MLSFSRRNEARLRTSLYEKGKILFNRNERLYMMNADGGNLRLLSDLHGVHDFKWSPDESRIAFIDHLSLYVINSDGTNLHKLDSAPVSTDFEWKILHPAWSPDGSRLSYEKEYSNPEKNDRSVITSKADGTDRYNLDAYLFDYFGDNYPKYCGFASWLPDGVYILFSCFYEQTLTSYMMKADGSDPIRLNEINSESSLSWSPDGKQVTFPVNINGDGTLRILNIDGANSIRLPIKDGEIQDPTWSPDGKKVLFSSGKEKEQEIYIVNADGSNLIRLTNNNFVDKDPAWSPYGNMIVFSSDRDGNMEIYVMNLDGSNVIRLTYNVEADENPQWSQ